MQLMRCEVEGDTYAAGVYKVKTTVHRECRCRTIALQGLGISSACVLVTKNDALDDASGFGLTRQIKFAVTDRDHRLGR